MQTLEMNTGVDKQLYGVTFPSSSVSISSLLLFMSLWFSLHSCLQKDWTLVTWLCCTLFISLSSSRSEQQEDRDKKQWGSPHPLGIKALQVRGEGSSQIFITAIAAIVAAPTISMIEFLGSWGRRKCRQFFKRSDYSHLLWLLGDLLGPWFKLEGFARALSTPALMTTPKFGLCQLQEREREIINSLLVWWYFKFLSSSQFSRYCLLS